MENLVFRYKTARCAIKIRPEKAEVVDVFASRRGYGHGTKVMIMACKYADDNALDLYLRVWPYSAREYEGALDYNGLVHFYQKFGFAVNPRQSLEMYRRTIYRPYSEKEITIRRECVS